MSDYNCSCISPGDGDYDTSYTLTQKSVQARKSHKCSECKKVINRGDTYELFKGVWDGKIETYKTCLDCVSLRDTFFCDWIFTNLWDDFIDYVWEDGISFDNISKLTLGAKEHVYKIIENYWDRLDESGYDD